MATMPPEEDLFEIQRNCLRLMGHHDDVDNKKSRLTQRWHTMKYYCSLLLVISAQWPMMDYVIYHSDDLRLATGCLSIVFTNVLTVIKITTFLLYKRKFMQLMAQFQRMHNELQNAVARQRLVAANVGAKRFTKLYYYSVATTALYFMVGPVVSIVWAAVQQQPLVRVLPMPMRFAFDFESSPGYECCYVYTALVTLTVVMYATAVDGLFVAFTTHLRGHFKALQHFLQSNKFEKTALLQQHDQVIINYIRYHLLLLSLADRVRLVYRPIVFGQFLMTSLQVCVIIYQLVTNVGVFMEIVVNCAFLTSILLQLLIYCYGGEYLKIEALAVGTAVQLSNWYKLMPHEARMLLLMLQRSQRAVIIQAGFYEASLANFMAILKAAMSYITLIQSIE